jgi:hypothetical protein
MTPKEKAKELVDKHCANHFEQKRGSIIIDLEKAKKSALISVEEIIKVIYKYSIHSDCSEDASLEYWQEVKEEILKL